MSTMPHYVKIKDYIVENIKQEHYKPGEKIPSEKELGDMFNVSRITATTAIRDLVKEGYIYRVQGKGSYVSGKKAENLKTHRTYGFENDSTLNEGYHKTMSMQVVKERKDLSEKFGMSIEDEFYEILRVKVIGEKVNALEYVYLPVKYYLTLDIRDEKAGLIHDLVEEHCFLKQKRAKVYIEPVLLSEEESKLMKVTGKSPMLLWEKFTFSEEEVIIEYSRNIINSDLYRFYMDLDI